MKKKTIVFIVGILICILGFNSSKNELNTLLSPQDVQPNIFFLGAMGNNNEPNLDSLHRLGANIWHRYASPYAGGGWVANDDIDHDTSYYYNDVKNMAKNNFLNNNLMSFMDRPKIEYLAFGQRSDYQCEAISEGQPYWFYAYNIHNVGRDTDDVFGGTTQRVRHCIPIINESAAYVCSGLRSNREQCNYKWNKWENDNTYKWHVMPRIRIPQNLSPTTKVCTIEIRKWDGSGLTSFELKARNFAPSGGNYLDDYDGGYMMEYNFTNDPSNSQVIDTGYNFNPSKINFWEYEHDCQVDFKVKYWNECEMWIDYVRVENDPAYELLTLPTHDPNDPVAPQDLHWVKWIDQEVRMFQDAGTGPYRFYVEEFEFNTIPCMEFVNKRIKNLSGGQYSLMINLNYDLSMVHIPDIWSHQERRFTPQQVSDYIIEKTGVQEVFNSCYPLEGFQSTTTDAYRMSNVVASPRSSKHPYTLLATGYDKDNGVLSQNATITEYENWLQDKIDNELNGIGLRYMAKFCSDIVKTDYCKNNNVLYAFMPQAHSWWNPSHQLKEPSNEELSMMVNMSVSYGSKGNMFFWYDSFHDYTDTVEWGRGLTEIINNQRVHRVTPYGQDKFNGAKAINERIAKWAPYLLSFNSGYTKSYAYALSEERSQLFNTSNTYFADIITYKPGSGYPSCLEEDTPGYNSTLPGGLVYECRDDRFVQASVFKNTNEPHTNYFMIINKRCSPFIDTTSEDNRGGRRYISVKFNSNHSAFSGFNNWSITDLETGIKIITFDKRVTSFLNLNWYAPGQGKLYKIEPVMRIGGELVADEDISSVTINLDTVINANGKNITLGDGVNIHFKTGGRILMSGGNFKCGTVSEAYNAPKSVTLGAQSGMKWGGICLSNMDTVHIQNTEVKDVDADSNNHGYGISLVNAKVINIDDCNLFNTSSTAAGIQINYVTNLYMNPDISITGNTVKISTDTCDGIYIHPYSWLTLTPYIYGNKIINTSSGGGEFGIFGFDLEGTAVKNNYIENFQNGILTWYSSLDLFENTITTSNITNGWDLYGIVSEYNLSNAYESRLGGSNILTTKDGRNICLDALDINLTDGNNIFNVNDSSYGYHMAGYYPTSGLDKQNAYNNCFKIMSVPVGDEYGIRKNVTESDGLTQVTFDFGSFSCPSSPNYCDFYIGGTPTDTVWIECGGGMGGGMKNSEFGMQNEEWEKASAPQENVYKQIYDSLSINMRKKQYELAAEKCITLLDNYSDSAKVINCVDKLYRTALVRNKVSELKSYYEAFIQNHPNNTQIINRMFYYIQKAKVRLSQYQSALQGFQTIMNQFPTSYEGLAARWDYMATQLLDTSSGSGGGEQLTISNEQLTTEQQHERLVNLVEDPLDKYDKKKFTKEDRKIIVNNVVTAFEMQKTKETKKLKELEIKITKNEASETEKKEYKTKSKLKELVKPQKVRNISEQISVVQSDIKKVFPLSERKGNIESKIIAIPLEYKLGQNYPNPFNPTTKINYEIPKGGFVSIKIYDLLGREIAELVNENKDAGRYTIDFNASKYLLASGIYFYRIKAGEFIDTKRMVLVK